MERTTDFHPGQRFWMGLAGLAGVAGVGGEALTHHLLNGAPDQVVLWMQTATRLGLVHALALVGLTILYSLAPAGWTRRCVGVAGWACCGGLVLFTGGLFILAAGAPIAVRSVVPVGGFLWVTAWAVTAVAGATWRRSPTP